MRGLREVGTGEIKTVRAGGQGCKVSGDQGGKMRREDCVKTSTNGITLVNILATNWRFGTVVIQPGL